MKSLIILLIATFITVTSFAQTSKSKTDTTKSSASQAAKYTCSMHPDVVSNNPGRCPKCDMALTKVKTYTCSMHPEVVSNKPGKCPKCNMDLTEVKTKSKKG